MCGCTRCHSWPELQHHSPGPPKADGAFIMKVFALRRPGEPTRQAPGITCCLVFAHGLHGLSTVSLASLRYKDGCHGTAQERGMPENE